MSLVDELIAIHLVTFCGTVGFRRLKALKSHCDIISPFPSLSSARARLRRIESTEGVGGLCGICEEEGRFPCRSV